METQTTVLNVVTWVKNQKKSREEILMFHTTTNKINKDNIYNNMFLREHDTCEDQPRFLTKLQITKQQRT